MKIQPFAAARRRGVALVLVLAFLVILSALVVAFFNSTSTSRREVAEYEAGVTVKQLSDIATNIVIGQISDATKSWEVPSNAPLKAGSGARLTYSTQPGLIRTYDSKGELGRAFKLYSSDTMVLKAKTPWSISAQLLKTEIKETWPKLSAEYTDLNAPILKEDSNGKIAPEGREKKFSAIYPILDPLAMLPVKAGLTGVAGFDIRQVPGYGGRKNGDKPAIYEAMDPTGAPANNPAPMPVQWIYLLRDGTLTSPFKVTQDDSDIGPVADWGNLSDASPYKPSKINPIVGRIAFWADDESCKVNINTAAEPTPWDTPRAVTIQDLNYGKYQPAQKEYQRFPGHPYMTALSPVLFPGKKLTAKEREALYGLLPRVEPGGTKSATVDAAALIAAATADPGNYKIKPDQDRLFASIDELFFTQKKNADGTTERKESVENDGIKAERLDEFFTREQLERKRFFLTANSRSTEVNLLGQPRISLWPQWSGDKVSQRTIYDKLAVFCSTLNGNLYSFQRSSSASMLADWNNAQVARNQELYKYLQTATKTANPMPGYGDSFERKWGVDRDQVLTEAFDYIRSTNLRDPQTNATQFAPHGQVAPIEIGATKGFGRFHTISQFGFHFIANSEDTESRSIEASFLMEPYSPSLGWYRLEEDMFFEVSFGAVTVDGQDMKFPATASSSLNNLIRSGWHNNGRERGGAGGLRGPVQAFGGGGYKFVSKASPRVKVSTKNGKRTMAFSAGTITVKVYAGNSANAANLAQTFSLNFPGGDFPIPEVVKTGTLDYRPGGIATDASYWLTFASRYSSASSPPHAPGAEYYQPARRWADSGGPPGFKKGGLFRAEDVVRCIVPKTGDIRLIAASKNPPPTEFVPVSEKLWNDPKARFLHIFSEAVGTHTLYGNANEPGPDPAAGIIGSGTEDQLHGSGDVKYHYARLPEIRPSAGREFNKWGDFDNGVAQATDGAFINKPDEGNTKSTNSPYYYFSWDFTAPTETFFSPNRLIPSAGMLGSLPTGVKRNLPWQTLLFRPQKDHPGNGSTTSDKTKVIPDHAFMDLFWMPVIEPYAISEPFSTIGKINLNYEIAPFSYIRRTTALHALMKSEEPLQIANAASKSYKLWDHETNDNPRLPNDAKDQDPQVRKDWDDLYNGRAPFDKLRRPIDVEKTLQQADARFAAGNAFRSATEISELHLVREGENLADYQSEKIWKENLVTGDNTRERPYTNLYARLTTKSSTFTVHMRVQTLRKRAGEENEVWREDVDTVTGEYRGSTTIERYVDLGDKTLPDFATQPDATLDNFYKFRIVNTKKFNP